MLHHNRRTVESDGIYRGPDPDRRQSNANASCFPCVLRMSHDRGRNRFAEAAAGRMFLRKVSNCFASLFDPRTRSSRILLCTQALCISVQRIGTPGPTGAPMASSPCGSTTEAARPAAYSYRQNLEPSNPMGSPERDLDREQLGIFRSCLSRACVDETRDLLAGLQLRFAPRERHL